MANINFDFNTAREAAKTELESYRERFALRHNYNAYLNLIFSAQQQYLKIQQCHYDLSDGVHKDDECWSKYATREEIFNLKDEEIIEICFQNTQEDFFSSFKDKEFLTCTLLNGSFSPVEIIFLLPDGVTLLVIQRGFSWNLDDKEYYISARLLEVGEHCIGKKITGRKRGYEHDEGVVYDDVPAFEFVGNICDTFYCDCTSEYELTNNLEHLDGIPIKDILTPMSFEEIARRLAAEMEEFAKDLTTEEKEEKDKQFTL